MKYIRIVPAICCAFFLAMSSNAQVKIDIGVKGGFNYAGVNTSASVTKNFENRSGYHVGIYTMVKVAKFGIQPEFVFSKQGQSFSYGNTSNLESNFDYLNIPIMLKYYLVSGLNLQVGPQFGFLLGSKGNIIDDEGSFVLPQQDLKNFVKSSDLSLGMGIGFDIPFGLNVTARYNLGISDINKNTGVSPSNFLYSGLGDKQAKNQVFQFSVGYRFLKFGR